MHRREFILGTASALVLGKTVEKISLVTQRLQSTSNARPEPVDLGDDITLLDYRIHPSSMPGLIGEIHNASDQTIDAPTVSATLHLEDGSSEFTWLSPIIPVLYRHSTVPVFGNLPVSAAAFDLDSVEFRVCTSLSRGVFTRAEADLDLEIDVRREVYQADYYDYRAYVWNRRSSSVYDTVARGIFRDSHGRIAGMSQQHPIQRIEPGKAELVVINSSVSDSPQIRADPFVLIADPDFSIDLRVGVAGHLTMVGCDFGFPWD